MSTKYKATMPDRAYFVTITTVGWIDVFTRVNQKQAIINSLKYTDLITYLIQFDSIYYVRD